MLYLFTEAIRRSLTASGEIVVMVNTDGLEQDRPDRPGDTDDHFAWHVLTRSFVNLRADAGATGKLVVYFACSGDNRYSDNYGDQSWVLAWNKSLAEFNVEVQFGDFAKLSCDPDRVAPIMWNLAPVHEDLRKVMRAVGITHVVGQGDATGYNLKGLDPVKVADSSIPENFEACTVTIDGEPVAYLGVKTAWTAFMFPPSTDAFEHLAPFMPEGWRRASVAMESIKKVGVPTGDLFNRLFISGMRNLFWSFLQLLNGSKISSRAEFEAGPLLMQLLTRLGSDTLKEECEKVLKEAPTLSVLYKQYTEGAVSNKTPPPNENFADEVDFTSDEVGKLLVVIYWRVLAPQVFEESRLATLFTANFDPTQIKMANAFDGIVQDKPDAPTSPQYDGVAVLQLMALVTEPELVTRFTKVAQNGEMAPIWLVDLFNKMFVPPPSVGRMASTRYHSSVM